MDDSKERGTEGPCWPVTIGRANATAFLFLTDTRKYENEIVEMDVSIRVDAANGSTVWEGTGNQLRRLFVVRPTEQDQQDAGCGSLATTRI